MNASWPRILGAIVRNLLAIFVMFAATGCVSSKYKLAKRSTPPVPIDLITVQQPLEAKLHTVIVYQGPGAWKREAFWDEYVCSIVNRGDAPVEIEAASLIDRQEAIVSFGTDPWALEDQSKTWWKRVRSSEGASLFALGGGTILAGSLAVTSAHIAVGVAALDATLPGAAVYSGIAVGATIVLVALPVYAVSIVAINQHNKKEVQAEFARRRFPLPAVIAPQQIVQGSFFFPITPAPRRLLIRHRIGNAVAESAIELVTLQDLHMKVPIGPKPSGAGPPITSL